MEFVRLENLPYEQAMTLVKDYGAKLDECINAIDFGVASVAYEILCQNPYVRMKIANQHKDLLRRLYSLGYMGYEGEKIFNIIIESIENEEDIPVVDSHPITWNDVLKIAEQNPRVSHELENKKKLEKEKLQMDTWLVKVVLSEILCSESPNFKNLYHMIKDIDADLVMGIDIETYYSMVFDFIRKRNIPAIVIVNELIKNTDYLYYFLSGKEYEMYFKEYIESLTPIEIDMIYDRIIKYPYKQPSDLVNIRYLVARIFKSEVDSLSDHVPDEQYLEGICNVARHLLEEEKELMYQLHERWDYLFSKRSKEFYEKHGREPEDEKEDLQIEKEVEVELKQFKEEIYRNQNKVVDDYHKLLKEFFNSHN